MLYLPDSDDVLLKPKEAAELAGVTTGTLALWAHAGKLACLRNPNGHRRYPWGDLRVLLKSVDVGTRELDKVEEEDAVRLYLQGWGVHKVAKRFGCSDSKIRRLLIRKRIVLRRGRSPRWDKTWDEVAEQIVRSILDGTYPPASKIPSATMLAVRFGISQPSVSYAIHYLSDQGWVLVRRNQGIYVRPRSTWPKREQPRRADR